MHERPAGKVGNCTPVSFDLPTTASPFSSFSFRVLSPSAFHFPNLSVLVLGLPRVSNFEILCRLFAILKPREMDLNAFIRTADPRKCYRPVWNREFAGGAPILATVLRIMGLFPFVGWGLCWTFVPTVGERVGDRTDFRDRGPSLRTIGRLEVVFDAGSFREEEA
ncbi:hypothetical protein Tco_0427739 [Tanacetum coccineum]